MLEPALISVTCERAGLADIEELKAELEEIGQNLQDPIAWQQHDLRFHVRLAQLSGNSVLAGVLEGLFPRLLAEWQRVLSAADINQAYQSHIAILEAVASKDSAAAVKLMEEHVSEFARLAATAPAAQAEAGTVQYSNSSYPEENGSSHRASQYSDDYLQSQN